MKKPDAAAAPAPVAPLPIVDSFIDTISLTIRAFPTLLNALTNRASGNAACSRSISDSFGPVNTCRTPSIGGASASGLVVSMTTLPARFAAPASVSADSAIDPRTARTSVSPCRAASSKEPAGTPDSFEKACSFSGDRLPILTS